MLLSSVLPIKFFRIVIANRSDSEGEAIQKIYRKLWIASARKGYCNTDQYTGLRNDESQIMRERNITSDSNVEE